VVQETAVMVEQQQDQRLVTVEAAVPADKSEIKLYILTVLNIHIVGF
jgi:hypothetical protein